MPNYPETHTREPPERKRYGTYPLLIVIKSSGSVNRLQPHREREGEGEIKGLSEDYLDAWLFVGFSALRRYERWCPLQRRAKEKTAEEGVTAC